jgi:uncharacterized protein YoxC
VNELVISVKEKVDRVEKLFETVEEKVKGMSAFLPLIMTAVNKVLDFIKSRKEKRSRKNAE